MAEQYLKSKFGMTPSTAIGWFRAGCAFFRKNQYQNSVDCLRRSAALDPSNAEVYQVLGRAYISLKQTDLAVAALKKAVSLDAAADWQLLVELTGGKSKEGG
ncbi:Tetratricopeptide repeat protein 27 [Aduncisulcus paluster]|uniref:Tetratricopeptide repeat protein 27 n=1 Tax=Aduncisulcus paluster TaxID=2918883 RepID=A0ABQ5K2F7_9EUKA|nr:Tetratricopeptide repeat protein 27 [Aduncisulcus paluster]|eukprot:gnl/Carplike_NY0171/5462_a7470_248.p1 GENE.gnl/Carplike_NY0171/5462_a7470_248~~gnl/Carplike_NY0171/5462_a7470_248.p1  ORF type:complete len:102 (-),score=14.15 gnl/Carplike_NY0171/5462_a7470_248:108-413(-)